MNVFLLEHGDALAVALVAVVALAVLYLAHVHAMRAQRVAHRAMRDADRARCTCGGRGGETYRPAPKLRQRERPLDPHLPDFTTGALPEVTG